MATFDEVEQLANEVTLLAINKQLEELARLNWTRQQWLRHWGEKCFGIKPAAPAVYRYTPQKVQPLRRLPYEIKRNLQSGDPGYEQQQLEYERQWLAQRRGYVEY